MAAAERTTTMTRTDSDETTAAEEGGTGNGEQLWTKRNGEDLIKIIVNSW
jgi:hypothetical protein